VQYLAVISMVYSAKEYAQTNKGSLLVHTRKAPLLLFVTSDNHHARSYTIKLHLKLYLQTSTRC
jgi:hypothetical protein